MFHLVDPNIDVLNVTREIIASAGFESLCFHSASAYLDYVNSTAYSPAIALITCYKMPDMDGYTLVATIRKKHPHQKAVIISGSSTNEIPSEEENLVCLHLPKPYHPKTLISALKKIIFCDDTCARNCEDAKLSPSCKFGLPHTCPFFSPQ